MYGFRGKSDLMSEEDDVKHATFQSSRLKDLSLKTQSSLVESQLDGLHSLHRRPQLRQRYFEKQAEKIKNFKIKANMNA